MTALLTDNLPLLAGAPNGIKKLRELILDLAVRGKLVPQDPSDEPASELLKRIAEEKAQLVAEGKIKKPKPLEEIAAEEWPFELPSGWEWSRLGDVSVYIQRGKGPAYVDQSEFRVVSQKCVRWTGLDLEPARYIEPASLVKYESIRFLRSGDILWNSTGTGTIGRACVVGNCSQDEQLVADSHVTVVRPTGLLPVFLWRWIQSPSVQSELEGNASGTTNQIELNTSTVIAHLTPIPPLPEQRRIVAHVDELMALCDRLEAQQADAESAHAQLVQSLLDSLIQASDATAFAANWQRLAQHFNSLFTTEASIDALKQTLLQLAVTGKLVPQDPSDEPTDELMGKIAKEIAQLHSEGKIRKRKLITPFSTADAGFETPQGWKWLRLSQITRQIGDGLHGTPIYSQGGGYYFVNGSNLKEGKIVIKPETKTVGESEYFKHKKSLDEQSILVSINGTIGNVAFFNSEKIILGKSACYLNLAHGVSKHFVRLLIESPGFMKYALKSATGTTIKNLGLKAINDYPIALPPLAEQHRIVAKVDQLTALCSQLTARVTQARNLNAQLATTSVERALAVGGKQASATTDLKAARTLLAAEVTHKLHAQRTFGQRKLQKVFYLAEHAARLHAIQGNYLRNVAGPHDRYLMNQVEAELLKHQWYQRIDRETVGHAYRPLSQAGQHRLAYNRNWSAKEQANIEQVIELMRDWDTDRCEMTVTLYAAWNDFIIGGRQVTDDDIVDEVMHRWNEAKLRFTKGEWLAVLTEMKKHGLLTPTGFGKRTIGGTLVLPGFE